MTFVSATELINWMNMTTGELDSFFGDCQTQSIPEITLRWDALYSGDWTDGQANSTWVTKCKSVITQANGTYDIDINIDSHTWYTTWDGFFDDDASDEATDRATYIDFIEDLITEMGSANVKAWMVLNEPQFQYASASENGFIVDIIEAAQALTSKPVSVRFMGGATPWDTGTPHYGSAIATACDFFCINTYWDARDPTTRVYGCSQGDIEAMITAAGSAGKEAWITEFGTYNDNPDNEEQRAHVEAFHDWAYANGVDREFCWVCRPEGGGGERYNIFDGYTPRPAFYELVSDLEEEEGTADIGKWAGNIGSLGEKFRI